MMLVPCMMVLVRCMKELAHYKMAMVSCKMRKAYCTRETVGCKMGKEDFHKNLLLGKKLLVSFWALCMKALVHYKKELAHCKKELVHCRMVSFMVFCKKEPERYRMVGCMLVVNCRDCHPMVHRILKLF